MVQEIVKNLNNKGKNNFLCCFLCINYEYVKHKYGHIDLFLCRNLKEGVVSMAKFIIASVMGQNGKRWNTLGYKVYNTADDSFKLLSEATLQNLKIKLANAEFEDGYLKGTQGDLKRYTELNAFDGYPLHGVSFVILGKDSEGYYLVVERPEAEENLVSRLTPMELKRRIKTSNGTSDGVFVANARVENPMDVKTMVIRPIKGTFEVIKQCPKFEEKDFDFGAKQGNHSRKWKVRIVRKGQKYGRDYCLVNNKLDIVEFYDIDCDLEKFPIGQMVSSYYLNTIKAKEGLFVLNGEVDKWVITSECMKEIHEWLQTV